MTFDTSNFTDLIGNIVNVYTAIGIVGGWLLRIFYIFLTRTTVAVLGTKLDIPDDKDIKRVLGLFHKKVGKVSLIQNLDLPTNFPYIERIQDFYYRNKSKISDLQADRNISLFLLAHQSIIGKLGYDLQDQKTVTLYHKLRDTYGNPWSWEKWYHLRIFSYMGAWWKYIKGWKYTANLSSNLDYAKDIVLKIQISFPITSPIAGIDSSNIYELNLMKENTCGNKYFLRRKYQIDGFEKEFKKHLKTIETNLITGKEIHILMNVPAPFAYVIGKNIHLLSPTVHLYEEMSGAYHKIFTLKKP